MSKPVTDFEPEDVLSSVRRLIAGNKESSDVTHEQGTTKPLVLSPQLRVSDAKILRLESRYSVPAVNTKNEIDTGVGQQRVTKPEAHSKAKVSLPSAVQGDHSAGPQETAKRQGAPKAFGVTELAAKIAALETAIAKTADQWEPDGTSRDAYSGTQSRSMSWVESIELDAKGKPVDRDPDMGKDADESVPGQADKPSLDDGVFRDLISEVVRAELQGALGERLTRSVRKLVRREINRALAARDFE